MRLFRLLRILLPLSLAVCAAAAAESPVLQRVGELLTRMDESKNQDAEVVLDDGRRALDLLAHTPDDRLEAAVHNRMALAWRIKGDYRLALEHAGQARTAAERGGIESEMASSLFNIAIMHFSLADYAEARRYTGEARAAFGAIGDRSGVARVLNLEGVIGRHQGNYDSALELLLESLAIEEELENPRGIRRTLTNIGLVHWNLGEHRRALEIYHRLLDDYPESETSRGLASVLNNIGLCHWELGEHEPALEHYFKALDIRRQLNDNNGLASLHNNIGLVYQHQSKYQSALEHYDQSLELARSFDNVESAANTMNNVADVHLRRGDFQRAREYAEQSLSIAEKLPVKTLIRDSYELLSKVHEANGDLGQALASYKKFKETHDSISNEERDGKVAELRTKFESQGKQREIEILKRDGAIKELELTREATIRSALLAGLVLLVGCLVLVYNRYRLRVAANRLIAGKNEELARQRDELELALKEIHTLGGLLPICSSCKSIRDDDGYWHQLEAYISEHSPAQFSHSLCPGCLESYYEKHFDGELMDA